ncbi:MAG TPA: DUF433 domain-containing protein [Ktedonobacterales bacterium]|nr:DUF433 domain-containing protein [Ktedonobacterales bacterium]
MSTQANTPDTTAIIRRSDKGLTISGTRVTLYALMDYLVAGWDHVEIREWLNLSEEQLRVALEYIAAHLEEVETEYREVVQAAEERRQYWEQRLREHMARTPRTPPTPEKAALYVKLAEQRGQTLRESLHDRPADVDTAEPTRA